MGKFMKETEIVQMTPLRAPAEAQVASANNEGIDSYDISDPVEIFNKYGESWCDKVLEKQKWKEKVEMLEALSKVNFKKKLIYFY